jgi:cytochrome c peroxidase
MKTIVGLIVLVLTWSACSKDEALPDQEIIDFPTPKGFPEPEIPSYNLLTKAKIALGKKLFFDPILSRDNSISCNSCHKQSNAFADEQIVSIGVNNQIGFRNSQPLYNLAWRPSFFRDGGVTNLELTPLNAITSHVEMDNRIDIIVNRLNKIPSYQTMFRNAFNDTASTNGVLHAFACFLRTLISADSPYDRFAFSSDIDALNASAKRGKELFFSSRTDCSQCHSGFNFTNNTFQSNASSVTYPDSGRQRITLLPEDRGKFLVPSLRNTNFTAPFMHDGGLANLDSVIEHYNRGGKNFPGKSPLVRPLNLSSEEKKDLVEFLKSLNDVNFINNSAFHPTED